VLKKTGIATLLVLLIFIAISVIQYWNEDTSELVAAQASSKDSFLDMPLGKTRYQVHGVTGSQTVILLHGFNGFIENFDLNVPTLVKAGYRVIVYDQWGRGLSDRPRNNLTPAAIRDQLNTLLSHLEVNEFALIGSSLGSVLAVDYALEYPDRVEQLILIAPAGWASENDPPEWLIKNQGIADLIFHHFGTSIIRPKVIDYFFEDVDPTTMALWDKYAALPGFTRSALSLMRHTPLRGYEGGWTQLGVSRTPTTVIWGMEDISFAHQNSTELRAMAPHVTIRSVPEAAHWLNIENAETVNRHILEALQKQRPPFD
jgi:pimeloyl-ACP methyl ester carboxylesterase